MKAIIIINPKSGVGKQLPVRTMRDMLVGFDITLHPTEYAGHAAEIARQAVGRQIEAVIAIGGDGTINEVAGELTGTAAVLGIVPAGSGNGLARHLHIPLNANAALQLIARKKITEIDYGIINEHKFFCTCGMGYDAEVSEKVRRQTHRGKWMYARTIWQTLGNYRPEHYRITAGETVYETAAFAVTCANASQYGNNAYIAPYADVRDGLLNTVVIKPLKKREIPVAIIRLFTKKLHRQPEFMEIVAPKLSIERENAGPIHIDGDAIEEGKIVHIEVVSRGLKIFGI